MNETIIAENLGKKYIISHQGEAQYTALRDVIADGAKKLLKPRSKFFSKKEDFWALKNISFKVNKGDRLGIIGKNGAGKTTLLKLLSRITEPTEGKIKIKGRIASLLEVGTGFHPELTGRENVFLNGAILGMNRKEIKKKFDEIVEFAGVERFLDTPVKRYSSGMYVRLAFAVAAHLEPEILLIDEVLAVGDAQFQKKCIGRMDKLSKVEGRTILFISHNMGAIKNLCNKCLWLSNGEIIKEGDTYSIVSEYLNQTLSKEDISEKKLEIDEQKDFQVEKVILKKSEEIITSNFECDDQIIIEIDCISRKPIPGLYGYLQISNQEQLPIIISDSMEFDNNNPFDNLSKGKHKIQIAIPPRILGAGRYFVYFNFTSSFNDGGFNVDSPKEVCSFNLIDSLTSRGNNRSSVLSTLLKWLKIK